MESDRKGKVLNINSDRDLCPLCPQKIRVPVKYTVSKRMLLLQEKQSGLSVKRFCNPFTDTSNMKLQ